ncbi:MAG: glycosyltransferase family 2 protein [Rhizobacter sp.]
MLNPKRQTASSLGIVVPILNDVDALAALAPQLRALLERGVRLVVVDGGSHEDELLRCQSLTHAVGGVWVNAPRGRARQMNAGAAALLARSEVTALWFLHADSGLPLHADQLICRALEQHAWGRFDVRIQGQSRWLPIVARMMNWRSRISGMATGDQGLFMRRAVFETLGGFAPIALMEDIEISRRLKRIGPPACLHERLTTSGRRWDEHGALHTIALMWVMRWRYWWGTSPDALRRRYYRHQDTELGHPRGPNPPHSTQP